MDYVVTGSASGPVFELPDSPHYTKLFRPRNLHWGDPGTIDTIGAIGQHCDERLGYRPEIGNIAGPDRRNTYSRSHDGDNFDLAYPWADRRSGASDPDGRSTAPYRTSATASADQVKGIDYGLLHSVLTYIAGHRLCVSILIGHNVQRALAKHIAGHNLPRLVRVVEYRAHEDHIHVNMKHTKLR
jgi:hypothetical protein